MKQSATLVSFICSFLKSQLPWKLPPSFSLSKLWTLGFSQFKASLFARFLSPQTSRRVDLSVLHCSVDACKIVILFLVVAEGKIVHVLGWIQACVTSCVVLVCMRAVARGLARFCLFHVSGFLHCGTFFCFPVMAFCCGKLVVLRERIRNARHVHCEVVAWWRRESKKNRSSSKRVLLRGMIVFP